MIDVSEAAAADAIADAALREVGRIDTWINTAAVGLYGPLMDLHVDDMRRHGSSGERSETAQPVRTRRA